MSSLKAFATKTAFNIFPAFRRTGARITRMSSDFREVDLKLPLKLGTRNYVGTIYGGCMYGAVDGIYMVGFIRALGSEYIVWDIRGSIEYLKPGRGTLTTSLHITDEMLDDVRAALKTERKIERTYTIEWKNTEGEIACRVQKVLYFRLKNRDKDKSSPGKISTAQN